MVSYQVDITLKDLDLTAFERWLKKHINDVLATACFTDAELRQSPEAQGPQFSVIYRAKTLEDLKRYLADYAPQLRQEGLSLWGDRMSISRQVWRHSETIENIL